MNSEVRDVIVEISEAWAPRAGSFGSRGIKLTAGPEDFPELKDPTPDNIAKVEKALSLEILKYRYKMGNLTQSELEEAVSYIEQF